MRHSGSLAMLALAGACAALAACSTGPYYGAPPVPVGPDVAAPQLGSYLSGEIVGGARARRARLLPTKIRPLGGGAVAVYMDRQEADLRRQTVGTGVEVFRNGGDIVLRMPSSITFPVGSFAIQPQFQSTLREIAQTLKIDDQTYVDVLGHTDSSGGEAANQSLSTSRAQAVANYLTTRGVARARIGVRGYGESAPIASNDSEDGKAQNRRVEIRVAPFVG